MARPPFSQSQTQLDKATIVGVNNAHTRQLQVIAQKVLRAKCYEVQVESFYELSSRCPSGMLRSAPICIRDCLSVLRYLVVFKSKIRTQL